MEQVRVRHVMYHSQTAAQIHPMERVQTELRNLMRLQPVNHLPEHVIIKQVVVVALVHHRAAEHKVVAPKVTAHVP